MPNIKLNYLYRDAGNNKNYGEAIFLNPDNLELREAEKIILSRLISEEYFYVNQWGLKDLHFETWDNELDHIFHEFVSLELTNEAATELKTLKQFLEQITCR